MKPTGFATVVTIYVVIEVISNFGKPESPTCVISSESSKSVVDSITSAIKHLDEVVLDTRKQL